MLRTALVDIRWDIYHDQGPKSDHAALHSTMWHDYYSMSPDHSCTKSPFFGRSLLTPRRSCSSWRWRIPSRVTRCELQKPHFFLRPRTAVVVRIELLESFFVPDENKLRYEPLPGCTLWLQRGYRTLPFVPCCSHPCSESINRFVETTLLLSCYTVDPRLTVPSYITYFRQHSALGPRGRSESGERLSHPSQERERQSAERGD